MSSFCSNCGKELDEGTRYCPSCGSDNMSQGSSNNRNNYTYNAGPSQGLGGTLTLILVLGIIWAVYSIISGITLIAGGGLFAGLLGGFGGGAAFVAFGVIYLIGGLLAILSCMYIYGLKEHDKACLYCLIGSIIALATGAILGGIIGILFYFLLKKEKNRFTS